ncbi:MAG: MBL fold metallo-hydrolase [Bacteroidales bacterium]
MGKITFLGTGTSQGVPMIGCDCSVCLSDNKKDKRLRSSALIEYNGFKILIDCGPDFRQQMLREGIKDVDAVLLTHQHKDHTGGLDDIRAFNYFRHEAFPIYAEQIVQESLKMEYAYAFSDYKYPGAPEYDLRTITQEPFHIIKNVKNGNPDILLITPIRVLHHRLPILGFRIGDLAYITDASSIPNDEFTKLTGLNTLVINCVREERHLSHFSLDEALENAWRINAKKTYLTHLSHQIGTHNELCDKIKQRRLSGKIKMPDQVEPAYDGLKV